MSEKKRINFPYYLHDADPPSNLFWNECTNCEIILPDDTEICPKCNSKITNNK